MVMSLDDLKEKGWSILAWFREDLQQVAVLIEVDKDVQLLQVIHVFGYLERNS